MSTNLTYNAFLKKRFLKEQPIFERKLLRQRLRNLSALQREQQRKNIEEKFKAVNRTANTNAKAAIKTSRNTSNQAHNAHMKLIRDWAEYATTPAANHPFNKQNYKNFRKYYISELNRLAMNRGSEWKSTGVRLSEFVRRQKNKALNFSKRSAENLRRAKQAAENAKRATARAASLKASGAKQLFNNPLARLKAFTYRRTANATTERTRVEAKIQNLKAKAANLKQQSKVLTSLGNANGAAAANAEAAVAAEAAAAAVAQLGTIVRATSAFAKPLLRSRPLGNTGENTNNEEYFNALENFNYALLNTANTNARTLLNIVKNKKTTQSQRDQAKQNLLANHPTLIFLENKLVRKKTRAGELIAHASTKI
jgi:hypothetical protein